MSKENDNTKKHWSIDGEKVKIGKHSYSINLLSLFSFIMKFMSLMIIVLSVTRVFVGNQIIAILSILMGALGFSFGIGYGKIANEAKEIIMTKYEKESLKKYKQSLKEIND